MFTTVPFSNRKFIHLITLGTFVRCGQELFLSGHDRDKALVLSVPLFDFHQIAQSETIDVRIA